MFGRLAAIALVISAGLGAACTDSVGPIQRDASAIAARDGLKRGQCFLALGLAGTQIAPGADGNATVTAPDGNIVTQVAVKAGVPCWFTPPGATGTYTIVIEGAPCYIVAGLGSATVTVTRVGDGPTCKDISHVEFVSGPQGPPPDPGEDMNSSPVKGARLVPATAERDGLKRGQCFFNLGLDSPQIAPGTDGNASITALDGNVVTQVAVKAGVPCWFTPPGATGAYTIVIEGAPCYIVAGLGTASATVTRVGAGPTCKDISHVEFVSAPQGPPPDPGPDGRISVKRDFTLRSAP